MRPQGVSALAAALADPFYREKMSKYISDILPETPPMPVINSYASLKSGPCNIYHGTTSPYKTARSRTRRKMEKATKKAQRRR